MAGTIDLLEAEGIELDPIFVTVDPKCDTPEVLQDYVKAFHTRFEGLTGKQEQIRQLVSSFLAYYEINSEADDDEDYLIDYTSYVYLVDINGAFLGYCLESNPSEELAALISKDLPK